jgi:DNA-binding transcriptional LysR family regulator
LAVAQTLNFGRAAREMHIAQPALSRAIRSLETDLGVKLFVRDHHRVELTDAGKAFQPDAETILARVLAARGKLENTAEPHATLTVGFRPGIIISNAVQAFTREHPRVAVVARRIEWDEQHTALLDGRLDIAWVRTPIADDGLQITPLFDDPEMIAVPAGHRLARKEPVAVTDLTDEVLLQYETAPMHGLGRPSQLGNMRTMEEKLEAVAVGHGLALVPATAAAYYQRPDIVYRLVVDAPPYGVALATTTDNAVRPEVKAFIDTALGAAPTA